jgi:Spy/CpxP family protein refolding chaperone
MNKTKHPVFLMLSALAVGALLMAGTALARGKGHGGQGKMSPEARQAKMQERMEKRISEKLAPKLGLDDRATRELVEAFKAAQTERHAAMQNVKKELKALEALVEKGSDSQINAQLKRVKRAQSAVPNKHALFEKTQRILTPKQQALLVLEGPKMKKKMKKRRMKRMRKRGGDADFQGGFGGEE